jgi:hypothetical protein
MKKKLTATAFAFFLITSSFCQGNLNRVNPKYEKALSDNLTILDTASAPATLLSLANNFERIGSAEKEEWLPFYYTAYCYAMLALNNPDKSQTDAIAERAESYLKQSEGLSANNSEISCLHAMIISARILVDPMNRWQTLSIEAGEYLSKAKLQNPSNPRPFLLEASTRLRTPETLGGGKNAAKPIVEEAIKKFDSFKPENEWSPNWGKKHALRLLQIITS